MWFKQYIVIVINSVRVVVGDAFFLVLHLTALLMVALLAAIPGFTYGEHIRLLRDQCQALIFMVACLTITFGFIRVLTDDFRRGTGSILMSRPVGAFCLISGKWTGVILSVVIMMVSLSVSYLWMSEVSYDVEVLNMGSMIFYLATIVIALGISALRHYLFGGSYGFSANVVLAALLVVVFLTRVLTKGHNYFDWHGCQSSIILFFGLMAFSAFLLPVAIVFDSVMVLIFAVIIFLFGLVSEYFVTMVFSSGVANIISKFLLPNWQYYWIADRIGDGQPIPLGYLTSCSAQAVCLSIVCMIIAVFIYESKEVETHA